MKYLQKKSTEILANLSLAMGKMAANTMCFYIYHQPEKPKSLKKLRRF